MISPEQNKKYHKNTIWYNNGEIEKQIRMGDDIPEGFIKGRLPKSLEGWNGCHLSEEQKYILAHSLGRKGLEIRWHKKL